MIEHEITHTPHAPWCEVCIRARGLDHHHRRRPETSEDQMIKVHFDYGFFRTQIGAPLVPFLVGVCGRTAMKFTSVIFDRRGKVPLSVRLVEKGLRDIGAHGAVVLRSDGESALSDLLHSVAANRRATTLIERGPRGDSQANGRAERSVRSVEEIVRVMRGIYNAGVICRLIHTRGRLSGSYGTGLTS